MPIWTDLIAMLLTLSPFILLWLITVIIILTKHGWSAALRIGVLAFPILIVIGTLIYGFILLPRPVRDVMQIALAIFFIGLSLCYEIGFLLMMSQRGELWVDSKPQGFIDMDRATLRFHAVPLIFALFLLISAGEQLIECLRMAPPGIKLEVLAPLFQLLLAVNFIILAFKRFQIRENGIVTSSGRLIRWTSISSYEWIQFQDKVKLDLHPRLWRNRKPTTVTVPPELRGMVEKHFEQQLGLPKAQKSSIPTDNWSHA